MSRPSSRDLHDLDQALSQASVGLSRLVDALVLEADADEEDPAVQVVHQARQDAAVVDRALDAATQALSPAEDWVSFIKARRWVCERCGAPLQTTLTDGEPEDGMTFTCTCWFDYRPRIRKALM